MIKASETYEIGNSVEDIDSLAMLPFAYKSGNNPWDDTAYYSCGSCGAEFLGYEVGYIKAGYTYANGEYAPCPNCGRENSIDRGIVKEG